jgi:hypothetical protein
VPIDTGVAYFDARAPRHWENDLDDMAAIGTTYVVHCASEFDLRWQKESIRRLVKATTERGMATWLDPWGVGEVFGGEPFSRFGAIHPEARQIDSGGRAGTAACLNQPAFREFIKAWIDDVADLGGDTLFWDEPTWRIDTQSGTWSCRCELCLGLFRDRTGGEMPAEMTAEIQAFQEWSMAELLGDVCEYGHDRGFHNAICIMPPEASNPGFLDWDRAASIRGLDNFGTDPYWFSFRGDPGSYVSGHARRTVEVAERHGLDHHVWIQAFEVPAGRETEINVAIDAAVTAGARNLSVWSYDGCSAMSSCECERPGVAWAEVRSGFRRIRGLA